MKIKALAIVLAVSMLLTVPALAIYDPDNPVVPADGDTMVILSAPVAEAPQTAVVRSLSGLCADGSGALLVTDCYSNTVLKVSSEGVTAFAGTPGALDADGRAIGAYFDAKLGDAMFIEPGI